MIQEARVRAGTTPLKPFLTSLIARSPVRVEGTAIFMSNDANSVPHSLINNLIHNRVLHEHTVFLTVATEPVPWVDEARRVALQTLGDGCFQVTVNYGFKDQVDLPAALEKCRGSGVKFDRATSSYFLSRATVVPIPGKGMALWRERLFAIMLHNVGNVAAYLRLPADRVIELGARVEI
jgi:KUP system potassium uptake protein